MAEVDRWFIVDAPIADHEQDAFGHHDVAQNLKMMLQSRTHGRLMIGLLGPFGVGKSTVIELLKTDLKHDRNHSLVRISAERHENAGLHRSLIYAAAEKLVEEKCIDKKVAGDLLGELELSRSSMTIDPTAAPLFLWARKLTEASGRYLKRLVLWAGGIVAAALLLVLVLFLLGVDITQAIWTWVTIAAGFTAIIAPSVYTLWSVSSGKTWIASWLRPGQNTVTRPRVEAADEFERAFAQLITAVQKNVVIAIDDIDRLSSNEVLETLNAIRSFQLTCPSDKRPVFIVSVDESVIRDAVIKAHPGLASSPNGERAAAKAYLDRLFVQRQLMPPHSRRDLRGYAHELLSNADHAGARALGDELDSTLAVLIHDTVTDPRHVIRLVNAFFGDYRLASQRESHRRIRSITPGEVTSHPRTLAQMTVLKVDFPEFFEILRSDTSLLTHLAESARTGSTEDLASRGINVEASWYADLSRYVSRTSGFVHTVDDLLPFIYLGQDEIDRLVGSRDAREAHTLLVNNQVAGLRQLLSRVSSDEDSTHLDGLVPLIVDTLENAYDIELANTLGAITHIVDQIPQQRRVPLANAFAGSLSNSTCTRPQLEGLVELARCTSEPPLARTVGRYLLGGDTIPDEQSASRDLTVLSHRGELAAILGADTVTSFLEIRIQNLSLRGYDEFESWFDALDTSPAPDLHAAMSVAVMRSIDRTEDDATRSWADKALSSFDQAGPTDRDEAVKLVAKTIRSSIATEVGRLAVLGFTAWESAEPQELAAVAYAILQGGLTDDGTLTSSIAPDAKMAALQLMHSAVTHAPSYQVTVADEPVNVTVMAARFGAALLKSHRGADPRPPFSALLTALMQADPAAGSILAAEFIAAWNEDGPIANTTAQSTLGTVAPHLDELDDTTATALRDALITASLPTANEESFTGYITTTPKILNTNVGAAWIPTLLHSHRGQITYADPAATQRATEAIHVIFANADTTQTDAATVLDSYRSLYSYNGSQAVASTAIASLPWPASIQDNALQLLAQQAASISHSDYSALARRLADAVPTPPIPPQLAVGLRNALVDLLAAGNTPDNLERVVGALPLSEATRTALQAPDLESAVTNSIAQEPDTTAAMHQFVRILTDNENLSGEVAPAHLRQLTTHVARQYPDEYSESLKTHIDSQLAGDIHALHTTWAALLAPLTGPAADHLYASLETALNNSVGDVTDARNLVSGGIQCDTHRERITDIAVLALVKWIRERHDPTASATLAASLAINETARTAARNKTASKPRGLDQRSAWDAARRELN